MKNLTTLNRCICKSFGTVEAVELIHVWCISIRNKTEFSSFTGKNTSFNAISAPGYILPMGV